MKIEPELSAVTIVLRGNFNPKIFHPAWMARHGLISDEAADSANISVVHPEITIFSVDTLFSLHVDLDRLALERSIAPHIFAADLLTKIFTDLLPHTPLSQLGINRMVHFDVGSAQERDRIGRMLAPLDSWGSWGKEIAANATPGSGGLQTLVVRENLASDYAARWIQAKVEPSTRIRDGRTGIYMETNDHFRVSPSDARDASKIISTLHSEFDNSVGRAEKIIDQIMALKS